MTSTQDNRPARRRRWGPRVAAGAAAVLAAVTAWLSADSVEPLAPPPRAGDCVTVGLLSNGFHASLALPSTVVAELGVEGGGTGWTEIGWGEAAAFQSDALTASQAARAVLTPGPTAVFVAPLPGAPRDAGTYRAISLSRAGVARLIADVRDELARDPQGRPVVLSRRHGGVFYGGRSGYGVGHTCNVWTAERLRRAGLPIRARSAFLADGLMHAATRVGGCQASR